MPMSFHVGQHVVCIDDRPRPGVRAGRGDERLPKKGITYTIRELVPGAPLGLGDGVLLEEIVNPVRWYTAPSGPVRIELYFRVYRFRPVRDTSIDVFVKMLEPVPAAPTELVDAA
jgi:hypothetical protein